MRYVVQKDFIIHNLQALRAHCVNSEVIGVVKGNAYGLGLIPMAKLLVENGVKTLAVSRLEEAQALRSSGVTADILLLSPPFDPASAEAVCSLGLIATVDSLFTASLLQQAAERLNAPVRAHLMLDTGFGRFGFLPDEIGPAVQAVKDSPMIETQGVYSHFYNAFSGSDASVKLQVSRYELFVAALEQNGIFGLKRHICSSAAALKYPAYHYDAVRVGSALLGRVAVPNTIGLQKVGFAECEIICVKQLPANHFVCYGEAYKTTRPTMTAVVPLGVCDGYGLSKSDISFSFGGKISAILRKVKHFGENEQLSCTVNGKKASVIGKVGLTDLVLDVTGIDCRPGDVAAFDMNPTLVDSTVKKDFV